MIQLGWSIHNTYCIYSVDKSTEQSSKEFDEGILLRINSVLWPIFNYSDSDPGFEKIRGQIQRSTMAWDNWQSLRVHKADLHHSYMHMR
jgi:hypothetical protein